jgi:hypothetical protein
VDGIGIHMVLTSGKFVFIKSLLRIVSLNGLDRAYVAYVAGILINVVGFAGASEYMFSICAIDSVQCGITSFTVNTDVCLRFA